MDSNLFLPYLNLNWQVLEGVISEGLGLAYVKLQKSYDAEYIFTIERRRAHFRQFWASRDPRYHIVDFVEEQSDFFFF